MSQIDLNGKVAIVTGGAGAIGKAYTEKLLTRGAKVCICDINEADCQRVGAELTSRFGDGNILALVCDVTSDQSMEGVFGKCKEKFGQLDIMINNAGIAQEQDFRRTFEVNLFAVIRGTEMAIKEMSKPKGRGGIVINTASTSGIADTPMVPRYSTSKAAVIRYSRNLGHEFHYSETGVRVLALCPGHVNTPLVFTVFDGSFNDKCNKTLREIIPTIQGTTPEIVADAMLRMIDDGKTPAVMIVTKEIPAGKYIEPEDYVVDPMLVEMDILEKK